MNVIKTKLDGCVIIEPKVFGDERGFFLETFQAERYASEAGIKLPFVQDNHSRSSKSVLRGLHFQKNKPQGKLVRVVRGQVYDVAVDIRKVSPTYGQWEGLILSEENKLSCGCHQALRTVLLCSQILQILNISALITMIRPTKAVSCGTILIWIFLGL
jgi:dTDP-4-dehydrorhamnose 3,5-epimerase